MKKESILCVDLGGTKILIGELTKDGEIMDSRSFPSDVSSQRVAVQDIKKAIHTYLEDELVQGKIVAISVDVVGRVDAESGIWYEINPEKAEEIRLADELAEEFHLPVIINNDVTSAALAEMTLGIGKQTKDFIYLNVGTGIAGRMVSNGSLITGKHFDAGEIGHTVLDMFGSKACVCGRHGCVESFASGAGMRSEFFRLKDRYRTRMHLMPEEKVNGITILEAFQKKDTLAEAIVCRATSGIAELIMNLVRVSDPEAVILGGGLMSSDLFYQLILDKLNPNTMRFISLGVKTTSINPALIALKGCAIHAALNL
jgi:predicted NBD/HSP70 family sugar kinase